MLTSKARNWATCTLWMAALCVSGRVIANELVSTASDRHLLGAFLQAVLGLQGTCSLGVKVCHRYANQTEKNQEHCHGEQMSYGWNRERWRFKARDGCMRVPFKHTLKVRSWPSFILVCASMLTSANYASKLLKNMSNWSQTACQTVAHRSTWGAAQSKGHLGRIKSKPVWSKRTCLMIYNIGIPILDLPCEPNTWF